MKRYHCALCHLPAKFMSKSLPYAHNGPAAVHDATLQQVLSRSLALNVPITHIAVPIRENVNG